MQELFTVILFIIYTWSLGYSFLRFIPQFNPDVTEKQIMRVGIGLGILPILLVLLNTLRVMLDWRLVLVVTLILPVFDLIQKIRKGQLLSLKPTFESLKNKKILINYILLFLIFGFTFYMYAGGAFSYSYLEDTDPWGHAVGVKYVSEEKTLFDPPRELLVRIGDPLTYMDPYPPAYDGLMGVLHQVNDSVSWTLKFFNSLIISLGIVFFYFFARRFMKNSQKALLATFILAAIPSYFTHFIWAHTLVIALIFPVLYCFERIHENIRWMLPAILIVASIFVTQPSQPIKIVVMLGLYGLVRSLIERKLTWPLFGSIIGGLGISFIWWFEMIIKYGGIKGVATGLGWIGKTATTASAASAAQSGTSLFSLIPRLFKPGGGTASRVYTFGDFFIAKHQGMINVAVGWGIVISILLVLGIIFSLLLYKKIIAHKEKSYWMIVTGLWFIFTFLGTNSITFNLPIGFIPFRFWLLLAIPTAILAAEGAWQLSHIVKRLGVPRIAILLLVVGGIYFTSFDQKESINTSVWPTRAYFAGGNPQVAQQFGSYFETLPKNTRVYMPGENRLAIGFDMFSCSWCKDVTAFSEQCLLDKSAQQIHNFLKSHQYEQMLIGIGEIKTFERTCERTFSADELNIFVGSLLNSGLFTPTASQEGLFISLKVN